MFTLAAPISLEFQTVEKKIEALAPSCVVLSSGNSAYAKEIIAGAYAALGGNQAPVISSVAEQLVGAFITVRGVKVREQLLVPMLGPDFLRYEQMNVSMPQYLQFQPGTFQQLTAQMYNFNLGIELLLCGVDQTGAHLAYVGHPGTAAWLDKLGYAAIGSGAIHATTRLSLRSQTRDNKLADTLYRVFEAKKAAEVAPGVGEETDIAIVDAGHTEHCSAATIDELKDIFNQSREKLAPSLSKLEKSLAKEHAKEEQHG
jgi:hypothetical protein